MSGDFMSGVLIGWFSLGAILFWAMLRALAKYDKEEDEILKKHKGGER